MFEKTIIIKTFIILAIQCYSDGHYEYHAKNLEDNGQTGTIYCTNKYNVNDTVRIQFESYERQVYGQINSEKTVKN